MTEKKKLIWSYKLYDIVNSPISGYYWGLMPVSANQKFPPFLESFYLGFG